MDFDKLREWVQAEIESAIEAREPGADGYYGNNMEERLKAERLFNELKATTKEQPDG